MDRITLDAYDSGAERLAKDWHAQPAPGDMQALIVNAFLGRVLRGISDAAADATWRGCAQTDFRPWATTFRRAAGASAGALSATEIRACALPELAGIAGGAFDNVLCETVIMHLAPEAIAPSVRGWWRS